VAAGREIRGLMAGHETTVPSARRAPLETAAVKEMVQAQVETVRSRLAALREAEKRVPNREQVELRLSQMLRHLAPQEFEALRAQLSPERFSIAHKLRRMVRDAALGRDVEE
jgi:hypothetical protein